MELKECKSAPDECYESGQLSAEQKWLLRKAGRSRIEYFFHSLSWRMPSWLFKSDHSYIVQSRQLNLIVSPHPDYQVRSTSIEDLGAFERAHLNPELIASRLQRGDQCVAVLKDDQLVGWSWSAVGRVFLKLSGTVFDTGDEGFFLYDVYTAPSERLKGFIMNCYELQCDYYRNSRRQNIYSSISVFNTNALRTHFRMGFNAVSEIINLKILGISLSCCYSRSSREGRWQVHFWGSSKAVKLV